MTSARPGRPRRNVLLSVAAAVLLAVAGPSAAEDNAPTGWQKLFRAHARDWEIATTSQPDERFRLVEEPVLRWSQPVRGGDDGAVFLWRDATGRPAVIGTLFIWPHPGGDQGVSHELHSLRTEPVAGRWRDAARWTTDAGGIAWRPVPGVPPPAVSPTQRLRQMRGLAEQFHAHSAHADQEWELRLLPRPVHRYEVTEDSTAFDGAIFAFVQGTDAEIILLIEARRAAGGDRWEYAVARMSDLNLSVTHKDEEVWRAPRAEFNQWDKPYVCANVEVRSSPDGENAGTPTEGTP